MRTRNLRLGRVGFLLCVWMARADLVHSQPQITTNDGLALRLAAEGRIAGVTVDGKPLLAGKAAGGFFICDAQQSLENQPNLLVNPSGEAARPEGQPEAWTLGKDWVWDDQMAHSGQRSFRVTVSQSDPPRASDALTYPKMRVEPRTKYLLRCWVRTKDCGGRYAPTVYVWQTDADGQQTAPQAGASAGQGTNDWFEVRTHFQTSPQTAFITIYANIYFSYGTAWFDDFSLSRAEPVLQPVPLQVQPSGKEWRGTARPEDLGLKMEATYRREPGRLRLDVRLEDLQKVDRALMVRFALPVDAVGWTWWDHLAQSRQIERGGIYENVCDIDMGEGKLTLYPFNSLHGPDAALTLGVLLDQGPRIWLAQYDARQQQFMATFYLGLSQETAKFPGRASFSLIIYRHDPRWGLRSAAKRFYEFYPEHFVKRFPFEATLNYANLEEVRPDGKLVLRDSGGPEPVEMEDGSDFGESIPLFSSMHGGYCTDFWPTDDPRRPTDDQVRAFLSEHARQVGEPLDWYTPPGEILQQITHDDRGDIRFHQVTWKLPGETYGAKDRTGWFMEFRVNDDPEITSWVRDWFLRNWQTWGNKNPGFKPFHYGMSSDEIEGYTGDGNAPDFRREHFRTTDVPLSYSSRNFALGRVNLMYDFLKTFLWPHSEEHKYLVTGNANGFNRAFEFPYVDLGMVEHEWYSPDLLAMSAYIRSMSYHKLYRYWRVCGKGEEDPESVISHLHRGLMWAIYPSVWGVQVVGHHLEGYRYLYRRYVPIIEELSASGWEPITNATVNKPGVLLERYGTFRSGSLHLAVQNTNNEPIEAEVTVDARAESIKSLTGVNAYDLTCRKTLPLKKSPGLTVGLNLQPGETRVFQLAEVKGCYLEACRQAQRGLGRWERLLQADVSKAPALDLRAQDAPSMARSARAFDAYLESLRQATHTPNDINRDKMFFRIADEFSLAALALLDMDVVLPNWPETRTGQELQVPIAVRNGGQTALSVVGMGATSPFASATVKLEMPNLPSVVAPGEVQEATLRIAMGDAGRTVLPVLVSVAARRGQIEATARRLLDVRIRPLAAG